MLGSQSVVTFVATKNGAIARKFYEQTLGLKVTSDDAYAVVCDANGTMLRIQKVERFTPQPFTALGWEVSNLQSMVDGLTERGVVFERFPGMDQDARGIWDSPSGARVAWFRAPDGNTLSLTQVETTTSAPGREAKRAD